MIAHHVGNSTEKQTLIYLVARANEQYLAKLQMHISFDPAIQLLGIIQDMQGHMCNVLYKVIHHSIVAVIRNNPHIR